MGGFYCFLWERINCGRLFWFVGGFKYNISKTPFVQISSSHDLPYIYNKDSFWNWLWMVLLYRKLMTNANSHNVELSSSAIRVVKEVKLFRKLKSDKCRVWISVAVDICLMNICRPTSALFWNLGQTSSLFGLAKQKWVTEWQGKTMSGPGSNDVDVDVVVDFVRRPGPLHLTF